MLGINQCNEQNEKTVDVHKSPDRIESNKCDFAKEQSCYISRKGVFHPAQ